MPDEIDYSFDPTSDLMMKELEQRLNSFDIDDNLNQFPNNRNNGAFNSRLSSRNRHHGLDEFDQGISIEENTCKQTVRVDAIKNKLETKHEKQRITRTMRQ